jgi:hypothetical protein
MLATSVLFLVFNRPDTTKQVFEAIRQAEPAKLYVAADGPRLDKEGEKEIVEIVRSIATDVDWDCDVKTFFRDDNLGCKLAVSDAITWFFEQEEEGIILEDDCLPDQSFFPFCQQLLEKYRHDTRIMAISGDNFQQGKKRTKYSYYFSRYNHVWGWASWRRAWQYFDRDLLTWPEIQKENLLDSISGGNDKFITYWTRVFDDCYANKIDTWDLPWTYSCWLQSGLAILPQVNLVSNLGFGDGATHTIDVVDNYANIPVEQQHFPLIHPPFVIRNSQADRFFDNFLLGICGEIEEKNSIKRFAKRIFRLTF